MQILDQAVEVMRKQGADGARVAAATAPDSASGGASDGEPESTWSRSSASGFHALNVPAAW